MILEEIREPDTIRFKFFRSIWNAGRDIVAALVGGVIGALIVIYLTIPNFKIYSYLVGNIVIFFIFLFFIYWCAKKELAL